MPRPFVMYRSALDGSGDKWGPVEVERGEACDFDRFPLGRQVDETTGRPYRWAYCAARFWYAPPTRADDLRDLAALPAPSAPLPSAAGAILGQLIERTNNG